MNAHMIEITEIKTISLPLSIRASSEKLALDKVRKYFCNSDGFDELTNDFEVISYNVEYKLRSLK